MKLKIITIIFAVTLVFFLSSNNNYAAKSNYAQAITTNPLGLAFGLFNANYEQKLSQNNSFTVNGYYWTITDWIGYGVGGSYRWYFDLFKTRQKPLEGFSVGATANFSSWTWNGFVSSYDNGVTFMIGGTATNKWVWDGFALEVGVSLSFPILGLKGLNITPFGLVGAIGYAW